MLTRDDAEICSQLTICSECFGVCSVIFFKQANLANTDCLFLHNIVISCIYLLCLNKEEERQTQAQTHTQTEKKPVITDQHLRRWSITGECCS